jgi:hypothetical protein
LHSKGTPLLHLIAINQLVHLWSKGSVTLKSVQSAHPLFTFCISFIFIVFICFLISFGTVIGCGNPVRQCLLPTWQLTQYQQVRNSWQRPSWTTGREWSNIKAFAASQKVVVRCKQLE